MSLKSPLLPGWMSPARKWQTTNRTLHPDASTKKVRCANGLVALVTAAFMLPGAAVPYQRRLHEPTPQTGSG